jgi:hypothetical protein
MIWLPVTGELVRWSTWLYDNRQTLEPTLQRLGLAQDLVHSVLARPESALRRVGNTLVFGSADGGAKVLGFLEQTAPRVESIQLAVDNLHAKTDVLSTTLGSLQNISMMTLGLSALTPVILSMQFSALHRRLNAIGRQIAGLHKKFDASVIAELKVGLGFLQQATDELQAQKRSTAHLHLNAALAPCLKSAKYFAELLGTELQEKALNLPQVRLLARHLSVAVTATASCQIALEEDPSAFSQLQAELELLSKAAGAVFDALVGRDPAPYLLPAMRAHGVTLGYLVELFRQARDASAGQPATDLSAETWFEEHRAEIFRARRWLATGRWYRKLQTQLREASAAVEETNRVLGLARLVDESQKAGQKTIEVLQAVRQKTESKTATTPFLVWAFG